LFQCEASNELLIHKLKLRPGHFDARIFVLRLAPLQVGNL